MRLNSSRSTPDVSLPNQLSKHNTDSWKCSSGKVNCLVPQRSPKTSFCYSRDTPTSYNIENDGQSLEQYDLFIGFCFNKHIGRSPRNDEIKITIFEILFIWRPHWLWCDIYYYVDTKVLKFWNIICFYKQKVDVLIKCDLNTKTKC